MTVIQHDFRSNQGEVKDKNSKPKLIPAYQLLIEVSFSSPAIWRRIQVPGTITLAVLHSLIQTCFAWNNEATYRFLIGKIFYGPDDVEHSGESTHTKSIQLHELEEHMGFIFSYIYDTGAGWECEITMEEVIPGNDPLPHPHLVDGRGACPGDTLSDIHEYQQVLDQLDEASPADRINILKEQDLATPFDPAYCDLEMIRGKFPS